MSNKRLPILADGDALNDKLLHTFTEWNNQGFMIKKGSKAVAKDMMGNALFSEDQIFAPEDQIRGFANDYGYVDYDYDDDFSWDPWMFN